MDSENNRNLIIAIALSMGVLLLWQFFYVGPKLKEEELRRQQIEDARRAAGLGTDGATATPGATQPGAPAAPGAPTSAGSAGASVAPTPGATIDPAAVGTGAAAIPAVGGPTRGRDLVLAQTPRIAIETPAIRGSLNLKGARVDDIVLHRYGVSSREDEDRVTLFSPVGAPDAYFAEFGWSPAAGSPGIALPTPETVWSAPSGARLTPESPVTVTWDNGAGLTFRRTFQIDENYLITIRQEVTNASDAPVNLAPYSLIRRTGTPRLEGIWISFEGLMGVLGEDGEQRISYSEVTGTVDPDHRFSKVDGGWLAIADKYWAAAIIPDQSQPFAARFHGTPQALQPYYQADFSGDVRAVGPGQTIASESRLFAGAKRVDVIDGYEANFGIKQFELLIDWGWFYFITKPLFYVLSYFYGLFGNFGLSILIVTVLVKLLFFPLANQAYVSMSRMKILQPELQKLQERYKDDRVKLQQSMMELYKKEKVNPMSGCLPVLVQIPVFFALYKVLFVSIEMRHAPFFGWIQDLSAKDPTSIFNLFGLLPFAVPDLLVIGIWPLIMGATMWVQMKLNPAPTDPIQQKVFAYMPILFTFLLAAFPAGLVIYWAWNNTLSVLQQYVIMRRQGAKVELWDNLKDDLSWVGALGRMAGLGGGGAKSADDKAADVGDQPTATNDEDRPALASTNDDDQRSDEAHAANGSAPTANGRDADAPDDGAHEQANGTANGHDGDTGGDLLGEMADDDGDDGYSNDELAAYKRLGLEPGASRNAIKNASRVRLNNAQRKKGGNKGAVRDISKARDLLLNRLDQRTGDR